MIEEIRIRGLGVIGDAVLELGPGLTVVTGETGAGKTMVISGLGLLLGERADAGAVRSGVGSALVEGRVRVDPQGAAADRAREAGADLDDDTLILARSVTAEGRSRAHLGGRSVPVGVLAELAPDLVAVHGQADQQRLQSPARQRELLDRYAGEALIADRTAYADAYDRLRAVDAELHEVRTHGRERALEAEQLRHALAQVDQLAPQPAEDVELAAELGRLMHADTLRGAAEAAHGALRADEATADPAASAVDVGALVGAARHALETGADHDPALKELLGRVTELEILADDIAAELASYAAGIEADPARLAVVQERVAALRGLTRLYGDDVAGVLAWADRARIRLHELDDDGAQVGQLEAARAKARAALAALAATLSAARRTAGDRLAGLAGQELAALAMPHATLEVALTQRPDEAGLALPDGRVVGFGPHGVDEVEILLSPHAGAPARPLGRGASGGELSRVMLALEVVLAGADPVPTFVFDEVDAGVGGRAAVEIGRRLAQLAELAQVLVVTHLPQVAAYADRHLVVTKADDGVVTESGVVTLEGEGRVQELARMLAGQEDSTTAQAHAQELLDGAREHRRAGASAGSAAPARRPSKRTAAGGRRS